VVWLTSAMPFNRAIRQFVPPIREAAKTIALRLADSPQLWSMPLLSKPRSGARLARRSRPGSRKLLYSG
jgi:hypothetical protein